MTTTKTAGGSVKVTIGAVKDGLRDVKAAGAVVAQIETTRDGYAVAKTGQTGIIPSFIVYSAAVWYARRIARGEA